MAASAAFSVVDARNEGVERDDNAARAAADNVLWCVEKATAVEQEALTRSAAESMLLENFILVIRLVEELWYNNERQMIMTIFLTGIAMLGGTRPSCYVDFGRKEGRRVRTFLETLIFYFRNAFLYFTYFETLFYKDLSFARAVNLHVESENDDDGRQ